MSNQTRGRSGSESGAGRRNEGRVDSFSEASEAAQGIAEKAKQAASGTASTVTQHVRSLIDGQVENGADMVGHLASSVKRVADELNKDAPQLAGVVRSVADRLEGYSDDLRDQSVDQLVRSASDYTRRQPAIVFGLAALVGFFAFRTFKSAPSRPNRGYQPKPPVRDRQTLRGGEFHGS